MHRYIPTTKDDIKLMLDRIGVKKIEDLFKDIPKEICLERELNLGEPLSEIELAKHMKDLSNRNTGVENLTCFLGAGAYDHYIPSVIKHLAMRQEFYTAYTPYQAEISQGTLQAIFEYQTMISNLTGMEVTNASMYDGATACVEAAMMAVENKKRKSLLVSKTVHPEVRKVLQTYMKFRKIQVVEINMTEGVTDIDHLKSIMDTDVAGIILQNPNFFGVIEELTDIEKIVHENKALLINYVDPISLGILKNPGELGADIVVGEGQSLGIPLNFGGPYLGFLATTLKLVRKMPGRIVGQSEDVEGKRAFVLTLQAREQHIRRFKATSNICSNQGLNALMATIYLATMGKKGLKEVAMQSTQKSHYALENIIKSGKYKPVFNKPFFKEFVISRDIKTRQINQELMNHRILGGYELEGDYPEIQNGLLFCVTEKRSKKQIDKLVEIMEGI
ncbi:glycine dehydrogenase (decarboxylating) alpha subunit [Anaerovirgula multivorans]|uniref:Probable glycine dehydrogenase (decarboxylating) subunit 1 n=1 Tax=Anaerovirgula multivorans TaxID=312168 RepID=A0A239BAN7_9FIRM|nr:aminomethyl-transferring glycine dehydrogenase subunit GcvPA [Anaerovirgula multivorans]SNS04652.1 glycine dehydrogenase (decarboxylating) alpha subunit [Anaerovirgula multivorans]